MKDFAGWLSVYEVRGRRFRVTGAHSIIGRFVGSERVGLVSAWARLPELLPFYNDALRQEAVELEARRYLSGVAA